MTQGFRMDVQGWYLDKDVTFPDIPMRSGLIHVQTWNPFKTQCGTVSSIFWGTLRALWRLNQMRHKKKLGCLGLRVIILCPSEGTWNTEIWVPSCHEPTWMMSWFWGLFHFCSCKCPDIARPKRKDKVSFTKWHFPTWWLRLFLRCPYGCSEPFVSRRAPCPGIRWTNGLYYSPLIWSLTGCFGIGCFSFQIHNNISLELLNILQLYVHV